MVNFTNSDKEKLFDANNLARQKVTALGSDGYWYNEPFPREPVLPLARVMRQDPTLDGYGTITPNFDDYPFAEGAIGTRYSEVRLHSYLPSSIGDDGYSCQTFFTVSAAPASNSIDDLNAVRIKPLIGPEYSPGRTNAAKVDPSLRGFELALYPAVDNGSGTLIADTSNGAISPSADPGASSSGDSGAGAGSTGHWSVDYENGIVRFSRPAVNGSTGVMNPNYTSGDINGNYTPGSAITLFATFYKYDGEYGIENDPDFVTVGDGYVSEGSFTGAGFNVLQAAINSLPGQGGTVFVKEGDYDYVAPVVIPQKVSVVGLNGVTVVRPRREPAFIFADGYSSIEGIEIHGRDGVSNGGAIELRSESASQTIQEITIKNCVLYAENDAPGIAFAPISATPTYLGIRIVDNVFKPNTTNPVYIGEVDRGTTATIADSIISGNSFQLGDSGASTAISFPNNVITSFSSSTISNNIGPDSNMSLNATTSMDKLHIVDNKIDELSIGDVSSVTAADLILSNNQIEDNLTTHTLSFSIVCGNHVGGDMVLNRIISSEIEANNIIVTFIIVNGVDKCVISNNTAEDFSIESNSGGNVLENSLVANNIITNALYIGPDVVASVQRYVMKNTIVSENIVGTNMEGAHSARVATEMTYVNSTFSENIVAGSMTLNGAMDNTKICDGYIGTSLTLDILISSSVDDNNISTTLTINKLDNSRVNSNIMDTLMVVSLSEAVLSSVVSDNIFKSIATFSGQSPSTTISDSSITGNRINGTDLTFISSGTTGNVFENSLIADNKIERHIFMGTTVTDSQNRYIMDNTIMSRNVIGSNIISGAGGRTATEMTYVNSIFSENIVSSMTLYGAMDNVTISDGYFGSAMTIGSALTCIISRNTGLFDGFTVGDIEDTAIADNLFGGSVTLTGLGLNVLKDSVVDNNRIESNLIITTSINSAGTAVTNSAVVGNKINGDLDIKKTGATSTGNVLDESNISNNTISGDIDIDHQGTGGAVVNSSSVNVNTVGGNLNIKGTNAAYTGNTLISASVCNNNTANSLNIDHNGTANNVMNASCVNDNVIGIEFNLGVSVTASTVMYIMLDSIVSGNNIDASGTFGDSSRDIDLTTYVGSIISDNVFANNFTISGEVLDCVVSDNNISSVLQFDDITDSVLVSNIVSGTFKPKTTTGSSLTGNVIGAFNDSTMTGTNLIGNVVGTNNTPRSTSCHIADGYVTVDTGNRLTGQIGTVLQHVGSVTNVSTPRTSGSASLAPFAESVWIPSGILQEGSTIRVVAKGSINNFEVDEKIELKINLGTGTKVIAETLLLIPQDTDWFFYIDATAVVESELGDNMVVWSVGNSYVGDRENTDVNSGFRVYPGDANGLNGLEAVEVKVLVRWFEGSLAGGSTAFLEMLTVWVT